MSLKSWEEAEQGCGCEVDVEAEVEVGDRAS